MKNYTLKVLKYGTEVQRVRTHSIRKFTNSLGTIKWQDRGIKVYIRVSYGKKKDCFGKLTDFYNDGWYENKEDFLWAFNTFKGEN